MTVMSTLPPVENHVPAIPILLYHSISNTASPSYRSWAVRPERFAEQLEYLHKNSYVALTVSQLVRLIRQPNSFPRRPVVITFDDGLADFYTGALPTLQRYELPATLYITTDYVGQTSRWLDNAGEGERPMLSWHQIQELELSGVECGAHTRRHPELDTLSLDRARDEIAGSKRALENQLGRPITSFAYPHGYHTAAVKNIVRQVGFTSACAVKHALSSPQDDLFALSRVVVDADTDMALFEGLLEGRGLEVAPQREKWQTKGWRLYRRSKAQLRQHGLLSFRNTEKVA